MWSETQVIKGYAIRYTVPIKAVYLFRFFPFCSLKKNNGHYNLAFLFFYENLQKHLFNLLKTHDVK